MVTFVLTLLLIGYGLNMIIQVAAMIGAPTAEKRASAFLALLITLAAAAGVIYLAVN